MRAGGGEAVVATDALEALGCDGELPDTGIVDLRADSFDIPALAKGESTQIVLDSAVLTFKGDSAEYADEAQSANVLGEIGAGRNERRVQGGGRGVHGGQPFAQR